MPLKNYNILKFNQYMKSDKMSYIIYADFKSLIEKIHGCEAIWKNLQQQN